MIQYQPCFNFQPLAETKKHLLTCYKQGHNASTLGMNRSDWAGKMSTSKPL